MTANEAGTAVAERRAGEPRGNERYRVLIADRISAAGLEPLRSDDRFELVEQTGLKGEELARTLAGFDAVIVRSATKITREALAYADRLQVIGRAGVGVDNIDVEAATELGIAVLNAPSGNTISAAELAFALLLALVRRVPAADRSMKEGQWDRNRFSGNELFGKTMGLVGAGRIGGEVARRARVFGMDVIAFDPYLTEDRAAALDIRLGTLDEVLEQADVISLHVPYTASTANMIGAEQIARMKKTAYLVNAARGGVVDEQALYEALSEGRLAGAAIDVFAEEPLPADSPLRRLDNVVLTPHLGASTVEAQENVALEIGVAVRAALIESDYSRAVNAPAIGGEEMRRLQPLLDLAERLGRLACSMSRGAIEGIEVRYAGESGDLLKPLASGAVIGVLSGVLGEGAVNFVNALHLAEQRGIDIRQVKLGPHADYSEYIEVRIQGSEGYTRVAGALLGDRYPRVVRIDEFHTDILPRNTLVVLRNRDVPGVIGRVGTVLGEEQINIAEYHQARLEIGGEALAAVTIDGRLDARTIKRLKDLPEIQGVWQVELD
ncbi:MAG TPA: phosphoglycerate dehydrogenase [Longimicrobiales bacterium]|nr:phosphoglycerate dehydrogenase [Longimicrobiales bacterium]